MYKKILVPYDKSDPAKNALGAALDLATKAWARSSLEPYGPASDFLPFVSLRLTFNVSGACAPPSLFSHGLRFRA